MSVARICAPPAAMDLKIGDEVVLEGRVFVVRGFDPLGVLAGRVYLEDVATGDLVTELMARLPGADVDDADEAAADGAAPDAP